MMGWLSIFPFSPRAQRPRYILAEPRSRFRCQLRWWCHPHAHHPPRRNGNTTRRPSGFVLVGRNSWQSLRCSQDFSSVFVVGNKTKHLDHLVPCCSQLYTSNPPSNSWGFSIYTFEKTRGFLVPWCLGMGQALCGYWDGECTTSPYI